MQRKIENKIIFLDLPGGLSAIFKIKSIKRRNEGDGWNFKYKNKKILALALLASLVLA